VDEQVAIWARLNGRGRGEIDSDVWLKLFLDDVVRANKITKNVMVSWSILCSNLGGAGLSSSTRGMGMELIDKEPEKTLDVTKVFGYKDKPWWWSGKELVENLGWNDRGSKVIRFRAVSMSNRPQWEFGSYSNIPLVPLWSEEWQSWKLRDSWLEYVYRIHGVKILYAESIRLGSPQMRNWIEYISVRWRRSVVLSWLGIGERLQPKTPVVLGVAQEYIGVIARKLWARRWTRIAAINGLSKRILADAYVSVELEVRSQIELEAESGGLVFGE
jgi:hypothetical protein